MINALNGVQVSSNEQPELSYLENIIDKKVTDVALSCIESFVHWFLTTFSCFYPAYDNLYKAEVARVNQKSADTNGTISQEPVTKVVADPQLVLAPVESTTTASTSSLPLQRQGEIANPIPTTTNTAPLATTPTVLPPPRVTSFLRKGDLVDHTTGKIAGLRINTETYYRDGEKYEYLTLNGVKVLKCGDPRSDVHNHFDLMGSKDRIIVKDSVEHPGQIEIEEYDSYFERIDHKMIVDPTKLYRRSYSLNGDFRQETVYVTNITSFKTPGYLELIPRS